MDGLCKFMCAFVRVDLFDLLELNSVFISKLYPYMKLRKIQLSVERLTSIKYQLKKKKKKKVDPMFSPPIID